MANRVPSSILKSIDSLVAGIISQNRGVSEMDGLRLFLGSRTHEMLLDDDLKLWHLSPLALFDMWENEMAGADPTDSLYIRGDEIG